MTDIDHFRHHPRYVAVHTARIDALTPWDAFLALDTGRHGVLLESARTSSRIGRYSVVAVDPVAVWSARGNRCELSAGGRTVRYDAHPPTELRRILGLRRVEAPADLPFVGGALGCVSYEARHAVEELPQTAVDDLGLPGWWFVFVNECLVFDHIEGVVHAVVRYGSPNRKHGAERRASELLTRSRGVPARLVGPARSSGTVRSSFTKPGFEAAVRRALEYIGAGDVYQVNLAQRLHTDFRGDSRALYQTLRHVNPSPFACYIRGDGFTQVGCSPERLVSLVGRRAETRPIAGTRPRGSDTEEDDRLRAELMLSPKERAEHVMLVDLERNDLGRVCQYGSVQVDELMVLERYSHVNHIVSNVIGDLMPGRDAIDLLGAMFPGGTITGCPKIRCMEIIDELEPVARHAYTGSVGYISDSGDMDMNIVIRTLNLTGGNAYFAVGAGIVADSEPDFEYHETLHKAQAMLRALEAVCGREMRLETGE